MTHALRIFPAADADLDEVASFIAQDSHSAALRLYDAVDATYRLLRDHPFRGAACDIDHPRLSGVRRIAVLGFHNYLVFYRVEDGWVEVIRLLHGARDIPAVLLREWLDA